MKDVKKMTGSLMLVLAALVLYGSGRNEKESEAVRVTVSPQMPSVMATFSSVTLSAVSGGVRGEFRNGHASGLMAVLLIDTARNGQLTPLRAYACNHQDSTFVFTGLEPVETDFAVCLQDRYGNRSDTAWFRGITPLYEEKIETDKWTWYQSLPSDVLIWTEMSSGIYAPWTMWDNNLAAGWAGVYVNNQSDVFFPFTLTVSLGDSYILSRIVIHHWRFAEGGFAGGALKSFQIYGSNLDRPGDDLFGGDWQLLGDFESEIPSGNAEPTQADKDIGVFDGENFFFEANDIAPNPFVPTKFMRFRYRGTWNGRGIGDAVYVAVAEVRLFGQKANN